MYVPGRSPTATAKTAAALLSKHSTPRASRSVRISKAEDLVEKLGDLRSSMPVAKIRSGRAALIDKALLAAEEYLAAVKGGPK